MSTGFEDILLRVSMCSELDSGDLLEAERLVLSSVMEGLQIKRAGIWLLVDNNEGISCRLLIDTHHQTEVEELVLYRHQFPRYFEALDTQRAISASDAFTHEATSEFTESYLKPLGITSMLDVPIRHLGKMIGIICCENIGPIKQWNEEEARFVGALADLYGRAITANEKERYRQQLEQLNQELEHKVNARTEELQKHIEALQDTQGKLIEAEKMASLGSLVAGVAHEVNTPLGIAITACSHQAELIRQIQKLYENEQMTRKAMAHFLQQARESNVVAERNLARAADLIMNFKKTAVDQSNFELMEINLSAYLHTVLSSLKPVLKKVGARFELSCPDDLTLKTFPGAIAQILTNLSVNACVHGFEKQEGNVIDIQARMVEQQIELNVKDNGKGMDEEVLTKAIEPFFTTKRKDGGSGLGLSIVYNLVRQSLKGQFHIHSSPGAGTEVSILLPLTLSSV